MKATLQLITCTAIWIMAAYELSAQEQITTMNKTPRWISDRGFWQIESSIHSPDRSIVYFYNKEKVLVYKEHVTGVVLNLKSKRVKMRLKRALETALDAWNESHISKSDQQWVSTLFKK